MIDDQAYGEQFDVSLEGGCQCGSAPAASVSSTPYAEGVLYPEANDEAHDQEMLSRWQFSPSRAADEYSPEVVSAAIADPRLIADLRAPIDPSNLPPRRASSDDSLWHELRGSTSPAALVTPEYEGGSAILDPQPPIPPTPRGRGQFGVYDPIDPDPPYPGPAGPTGTFKGPRPPLIPPGIGFRGYRKPILPKGIGFRSSHDSCNGRLMPVCTRMSDQQVTWWIDPRWCTSSQEDKLHAAAMVAARILKTGFEFLQLLGPYSDAQREVFWNFGWTPHLEMPFSISHGWATSPAPRFWLGPYTYSRYAHALRTMRELHHRISRGFSYLNVTMLPYRFYCRNNCAAQAIGYHMPAGHVTLCPKVWNLYNTTPNYLNRVGGKLGLALVIIHELAHWTHGLNPRLTDKKECDNEGGIGGIAAGKKCYGPEESRGLIERGMYNTANANIDNFVHWAGARWMFFGRCIAFDPNQIYERCDTTGDETGQTTRCCVRCLSVHEAWADCVVTSP